MKKIISLIVIISLAVPVYSGVKCDEACYLGIGAGISMMIDGGEMVTERRLYKNSFESGDTIIMDETGAYVIKKLEKPEVKSHAERILGFITAVFFCMNLDIK